MLKDTKTLHCRDEMRSLGKVIVNDKMVYMYVQR